MLLIKDSGSDGLTQRSPLYVIVSGEGWAETQLCGRIASDSQKASRSLEEWKEKRLGGRKALLFVSRKRLSQEPSSMANGT